jgi:hypothetical protein
MSTHPGLGYGPTPNGGERHEPSLTRLHGVPRGKQLVLSLLIASVSLLAVFATPAGAQSNLLNLELESFGNLFGQNVTDFSGSKCRPTGVSTIRFRAEGSVLFFPRSPGPIPVLGRFTAVGRVRIGPQNITVPNRPPNSGFVRSFRETFHITLDSGERISGTKRLSPVIPAGVINNMDFTGYPGNLGHCRDDPLGPESFGFALVNRYRRAEHRSGLGFTQTFPIFDGAGAVIDAGFRENFLSSRKKRDQKW